MVGAQLWEAQRYVSHAGREGVETVLKQAGTGSLHQALFAG